MNLLNETLILILPIYTDTGDCTLLKTTASSEIFEKSIKSILNRLFFMTSQDPKSIKLKLREQGIKNTPPLIIGSDIFVKIKVRKPRASNDKAYGYINTDFIEKVVLRDDKVVLTLKDDTELEILDRYSTISKNITIATSVEIDNF